MDTYPHRVSLPAAYIAAVATRAQELMQQDLANNQFADIDVQVTVEGDHFAFALVRGGDRRVWRW